VFWKEMLRDLMHSMGMSMVRDKSVGSFMDRLHRGVQAHKSKMRMQRNVGVHAVTEDINSTPESNYDDGVVPGWVELRKGFFSLLSEAGDLIIFKDNVLNATSPTTDSVTVSMSIEVASSHQAFALNNWEITVQSCSCQAEGSCGFCRDVSTKLLPDPAELLKGEFSYSMNIPTLVQSSRLKVQLIPLASTLKSEEQGRRPAGSESTSQKRKKKQESICSTGVSPQVDSSDVVNVLDSFEELALFDQQLAEWLPSEKVVAVAATEVAEPEAAVSVVTASEYRQVLDVPALVGLDSKLKSSLPLLVPLATTSDIDAIDILASLKTSKKNKSKTKDIELQTMKCTLTYRYVGGQVAVGSHS
jgi:hypothetical protein